MTALKHMAFALIGALLGSMVPWLVLIMAAPSTSLDTATLLILIGLVSGLAIGLTFSIRSRLRQRSAAGKSS